MNEESRIEMKKMLMVFVSFILAILLLSCASNQPITQPSYGESQTQYSCKNINLGLREDEVLQVLGNPHDRRIANPYDKRRSFDSRGASETWTYNRSGTFPLRLFFSNGRVINCQD
jgi:hypothetical protein